MATYSYKRFGAIAPGATTNTTLFQVPTSHEYIIDESGITVCNRTSGDLTFRVARVDSGTTPANDDWVEYDQRVAGNSSISGILPKACFAATDSVVVYISASGISFTAGGLDIDKS